MPEEHELAEIAGRLRRAVAPALDLAQPDPEAVRLATLEPGPWHDGDRAATMT
jgi:hypothetical protein